METLPSHSKSKTTPLEHLPNVFPGDALHPPDEFRSFEASLLLERAAPDLTEAVHF